MLQAIQNSDLALGNNIVIGELQRHDKAGDFPVVAFIDLAKTTLTNDTTLVVLDKHVIVAVALALR